MYKGKIQMDAEHKRAASARKRSHLSKKFTAMLLSTVLLLAVAVGGTVAWLATKTNSIENVFTTSKVACEVTEDFNKTTGVKSNVNVKNTGDTDAYIRVKLVSYRTNEEGQHIGGTAEVPTFTPGTNWVLYNGYYYYTKPVAAGASPATALISGMQLQTSYTDADGGMQAIDVMAEAIQSVPAKAIGESWGVSISNGSVTAYSGN